VNVLDAGAVIISININGLRLFQFTFQEIRVACPILD